MREVIKSVGLEGRGMALEAYRTAPSTGTSCSDGNVLFALSAWSVRCM